MAKHVKQLGMLDDRMGKHVNLSGLAEFEVVVSTDGTVFSLRAITGHPIATALLLGAVQDWQFEPYLPNGVARKACGRLRLRFSVVENVSSVQLAEDNAVFSEQLPRVVSLDVPFYPPLARAAHVEGTVIVKVITNGEGVVTREVVSGHPILVDAAEENIRTWTFQPHTPASFTTTFEFRLAPDTAPDYQELIRRFPDASVRLVLPGRVEITTAAAPVLANTPR